MKGLVELKGAPSIISVEKGAAGGVQLPPAYAPREMDDGDSQHLSGCAAAGPLVLVAVLSSGNLG